MATTSATTSEHVETDIHDDDKKKKEEEAKKLQTTSTASDQGDKTKDKIDDLNQSDTKGTLSSVQSNNENKKSDQVSPTSDNKNEEKKVETTTTTTEKKEESSTSQDKTQETTSSNKDQPVTSSTTSNDTKKEESTASVTSDSKAHESAKDEKSPPPPQVAASDLNKDTKKDDDSAFPIEKGNAEHLTDFQRQKAKYFFNINLDIENKEYITWEDVEFYLLFHATTAGKEGSDGGDLEARLSRAARAFWEHVHDQIPLPDGKRDTLTLDQFLDTWASLIDYVVRTNQLPPIVHDLVKLGFELYSTENSDDKKSATIQPTAFDQLFQKMNLGRPYAIMAYKYLTENGAKPLDADKIDSIVKAVIISSDDEHDSHFLLPGFFKAIADSKNNENKKKLPSPVSDKGQSEVSDKSSAAATPTPPSPPTSTPSSQSQQPTTPPSSSSQTQQKNGSSSPPLQGQKPAVPSSPSQTQQKNGSSSPPLQGQKPAVPPSSSQSQQQTGSASLPPKGQKQGSPPSIQKQSSVTSQNETIKSPPSGTQQQNAQQPPKQVTIQQEDESIRRLLHYYHIDDGDVVEILGGSPHRLVLVHPERPLPPYILQDKKLLERLHLDSKNVSSPQQNGSNVPPNQSNTNEKSQEITTTAATETKPKVTLEERLSSGEAQKGPTTPLREEQKQESSSSLGVRQVYPQLSEAQQEEQQKQAKLQATQPINEEEKTTEETSTTNNKSSVSKSDDSSEKKDYTRDDEDKIVAAVLKQLTPIVEKRVAAELRRIHSGKSDQDEDDTFMPFPMMFAGGSPFFGGPRGGPSSQEFGQQQPNGAGQGQEQVHGFREGNFGGPAGGATFIPPQLLMAMMSDLARGGMGGDISGFQANMPPPHFGPGGAPTGVEGFMMFVDDDQMMRDPPGYPSGPGRRF